VDRIQLAEIGLSGRVFEHGNELLDTKKKGGEFLDQLNNYQIPKTILLHGVIK
jgi:hypothetical protein